MVATQLSRRKGGGSILKKLWEADLRTLSFPVFRGGGGGPSLVFWTKQIENNIDGTIFLFDYIRLHLIILDVVLLFRILITLHLYLHYLNN